MKDGRTESTSASVSEKATQVEEARTRWSWTEPSVWTERMLLALEQGVKGGKWFSLIDKVYSRTNLESAFEQVRRNQGGAGVDHMTVSQFQAQRELRLAKLAEWLREGSYRPKPVKRTWIPKPGSQEKRPLGIPAVVDRVAQAALRNVIEPIFEHDFAEQSYGFRPGRGCKDALRRVDELLHQGYVVILDADLKSYFDTIPHDRLMERVKEKISDGRVLSLIQQFLEQDIMDSAQRWTPEGGTPQGAVISPLLANLYLNPLDHLMARRGFQMVRYADDFVVMCRSSEEANEALEIIRAWTGEEGLTLHPTKTRLVDATTEDFEFLGYRFSKGRRYPRDKSLARVKEMIRSKTPRTNGLALSQIIAGINRPLRAWFEYFKHAHRNVFPSIDGFVRRRLRSILRTRLKRGNKRRYAKGADNVRWPNAYFARLGLFSLKTAWERGRQPVLTANL